MLVPLYDKFVSFGCGAGIRDRPAEQLSGALRRLWNIREYGATKPMLQHAKQFIRKLSHNFGTRPLKGFAGPVLGLKILKNICLKGGLKPTATEGGGAIYLGPAVVQRTELAVRLNQNCFC